MARYQVKYHSKSRDIDIEIDDEVAFNDFHLVAAYNKLKREMDENEASGREQERKDLLVFDALQNELQRRNLDPQYKGGKPPLETLVPDVPENFEPGPGGFENG